MKRTIETTVCYSFIYSYSKYTKSIDEELQKGNFQKAEQLSDTMQNELNLQEKKKLDIIARYTKELEDKSQNKKKKPKLHWGYLKSSSYLINYQSRFQRKMGTERKHVNRVVNKFSISMRTLRCYYKNLFLTTNVRFF